MRLRRLVGVPLILLVVACGKTGISNSASANPRPDADLQHIALNRLPARVAKARALRSKWRSWALAHRVSLIALRSAGPDDIDTLRRVFKLLPEFPDGSSTGISFGDLNGEGLPFTWRQSSVTSIAKDNFRQRRDVELSRSMAVGKYTVHFWVSGRITQTESAEQPMINGRYQFPGQAVFREIETTIEPPYEFLRP